MKPLVFPATFEALTGNAPFPWQTALYERFCQVGDDNIPKACNLPTGLGKTSVIAIWLIALANFPKKMPRRLVYVVNRRTVVDQTTEEVEKYFAKKVSGIAEFAISTLRGQFADNRDWSADPSRPAVICGTVDMIGSRLLFGGYGIGFKGKPLHAGFLGQDALVVHDEAHLEPAFQQLLIATESEQERCNDARKLRVMELTATSRGKGEVFSLSAADETNPVVNERINAKKSLVFHTVADEKKHLADKLLELCRVHKDSGKAILVFVRTVEALGTVVAGLRKAKCEVQILTGTMRGLERNNMADPRQEKACPIFARFLPPPRADAPEGERWKVEPKSGTVYLVCTSAGEVGVNISADHLVCDLSPFDSMAQRFGRVNRFGKCPDTRIDIVAPATFDDKELDVRRERTLALLFSLNGTGSPAALGKLDPKARVEAFSPQPIILPVTDILFDAWALTTIRDKLPGRPPVAEYLHGKSEWEPPQTKVAWREEVWEIRDRSETDRERKRFQKYAAELLEDYPLKTHELLGDRTDRVFNALKKLAAAPETPVWIIDDEDRVIVTTLGKVVEGDKDDLDDMTILLPRQAGGLDKGLLDGSSKYDSAREDYDVADEWLDKVGRLRKREWDKEKMPKMKLERVIEIRNSDDDDAEPTKVWYWFVRPTFADADAKASQPYDLQPHLDDAKAAAERFVATLIPDAKMRDAIALAAGFHDLGKDRRRWQRGIGNADYPKTKLAKSGNRRAATERSSYRHEFGSLLDIAERDEFKKLDPEYRELVLHLIAAHHGRARPHFPTDEAFDDNHSHDNAMSLAMEVPRRFARLQRKYGRWGLAYLESLVRAADILASKKAEGSDS